MRYSVASGVRVTLGLLSVLSGAGAWLACSSSSGGPAAGGSDASTDVSTSADVGTTTDAADAGGGEEASACTPHLSGTPVWSPSTGYPMNACSSAALDTLMTDCVGATFDGPKCAQDRMTYAACTACIYSPPGAPMLGPFTRFNDILDLNTGGCIALVSGDTSASGCGATAGLATLCVGQSCLGCTHPLPEGGVGAIMDASFVKGDLAAFQACAMASIADGGPCAADNAASQTACPNPPPPAYDTCLQASNESQAAFLMRFVAYFCGGLPGDAGPDASGDAAGDGATDAPPG